MSESLDPVLILGAGVNGICVARELVLNGVPVWLVDTHDIAFGATAKSSRLIHGGLRYLEYGDFRLVAESLKERDRLLRLAPQYVKPLRLQIPIRRRFGGFIAAGLRFLGLNRTRLGQWIGSSGGRGLMTVRFGLWLYDCLARSRMLPQHSVHRTGEGGPKFPVGEYPWSCAYFDGQMERPERFCLALLLDIEEAAKAQGTEFRLLTYHRAVLQGSGIEIRPVMSLSPSTPLPLDACPLPLEVSSAPHTPARTPTAEPVPKVGSPVGEREKKEDSCTGASSPPPLLLSPSLIINATGAWGDWTLKDLPVPAPQLLGGTKGSHVFTVHAGLIEALGGDAIYAEASDGRLVFLIPIESGVMIGTTDERFDQRPELACSTESEMAYLLKLTNELFPQIHLTEADIHASCSGIRPLPYTTTSKTAAISRDHQIDRREIKGLSVLTLIGGKLTTCRALGELVADQVLKELGRPRTVSTRERLVPGAEGYPVDPSLFEQEIAELAETTGHAKTTCRVVWQLIGTRALVDLRRCDPTGPKIVGTPFPREFVRQLIQTEWVTQLEDLVERRLLFALEPNLSRETLTDLAELLAEQQPGEVAIEETVERTCVRLRNFYGRRDV